MKTCSACGKPIPDDATVCPLCGQPVAPAAENPPAGAPFYTATPGGAPVGGRGETPALQTLRRLGTSPLYLVGAVGYTVMVVCNLISVVLGAVGVSTANLSWMADSAATAEALEVMDSAMSTIAWSSLVWSVVAQIPTILIAVGIWMMYASAWDRSGAPLRTAGLTIIRVIEIIFFVLFCLMAVLMLVLLGIGLTTVGFGQENGAALGIVMIPVALFIAVMVLAGVYMIKLIGTIDSFRKTIWTGTCQGNISAFVAVMAILGGIVMLIYLPLGLVAGAPFTVLAGIGGAVAGIGFAVFLFRCRDAWRQLAAAQPPAAETV